MTSRPTTARWRARFGFPLTLSIVAACLGAPADPPAPPSAADASDPASVPSPADATPRADAGPSRLSDGGSGAWQRPAPSGQPCERPTVPADALDVTRRGARGDGKTDDTAAIQKAVDEAAGTGRTVYVPDGTYLIQGALPGKKWGHGIWLKSKMRFVMAPGAILKVIPNSADVYFALQMYDETDIDIAGGVLVGERAEHKGTTGENGNGIGIYGGQNVTVRHVTARDFWGDGLYIGSGDKNESKNITICEFVADGNRRQGLSITGADGVVIRDSVFANTRGSVPECGIDLESNPGEHVRNVVIDSVALLDNAGYGMCFSDRAEGCVLRRSLARKNGRNGVTIMNGTGNTIEDSLIEDNAGRGLWLYHTTNNHILRNTIRQDGSIYVDASTGNRLEGNTLRAGSGACFVRIDAKSADNVFVGNDLDDPAKRCSIDDKGQRNAIRSGS